MNETSRPNILWICTDQQRCDTLNCYGAKFTRTPNIDRLAANGEQFQNAYVQNPVCMPSRASFLTGRYPRACRVRYNGQDVCAAEEAYLIPRILRDEAGYFCGLSGKLNLSLCNPAVTPVMEPRVNDGYDYFAWSQEQSAGWPLNAYTMWLKANGKKYFSPPREDCKYVNVGMPPEYHQTKWCADRALEFMENAADYKRPWLFSFNCLDPHHSFNPPPEYLERYLPLLDQIPLPDYTEGELEEKSPLQRRNHFGAYGTKGFFAYPDMTARDHRMIRAAYYAMCDFIDVQVGRMLDCLEKTGQLDNTIVIFHSDHGESLGDHGIYLKGPYFYESGVHVPLIISCPKRFQAGVSSRALVELTDIAPTLLEAAGLPYKRGMQGKSLYGLLSGSAPLDTFRDSVYCEMYADGENTEPLAYATMIFDGRYKLTRLHVLPDGLGGARCEGELYDLESDPGEKRNLYNDLCAADAKRHCLEIMCDRMALTCDPMPLNSYYHKGDHAIKNGIF